MAIVKTMECANGGRITIRDDRYRDASAEELARRRAETSRAILAIDRKAQLARRARTVTTE